MNDSTDRGLQPPELTRKINQYRAAANTYPVLREILTRFDGKVLNVKLQKALNEADKENRYYVDLRRNANYGDLLEICVHTKFDTSYVADCCVVDINLKKTGKWDGKRIPSAAILENARERREEKLRKAAELEAVTYARIDEIKTQMLQIQKMVDTIRSEIPYEARQICNLDYHLKNY